MDARFRIFRRMQALLMGAALVLTGCPSPPARDTAAREGVPPRRIVSLTLMTDEILVDLVEPERIAALSVFAADPRLSNVAGRAERFPALAFHVEPVIALRPDLVFVADWSDAAKVRQLRDAGIPVRLIASPSSLEEVRAALLDIGRAVQAEARARALADAMDESLATVAEQIAKVPAGQRVSVIDWHAWGGVSAAGSSWDAVVRAAGLVNAAAGLRADARGRAPLSSEHLLELDPDFLVLPGWLPGEPGAAERFRDELSRNPALRPLRAVREERVILMPEHLRSTTSHYIADAIRYLAGAAYPAIFDPQGPG